MLKSIDSHGARTALTAAAGVMMALLWRTTAVAAPPAESVDLDMTSGEAQAVIGCIKIIEHPVDKGVLPPGSNCSGPHSATFTVHAVGAGVITYQWFVDGVLTGANSPSLTLTDNPALDGAQVWCVLSDPGCPVPEITSTATFWVGRNSAADFQADCDVDIADFAPFAQCFGGANLPESPACLTPGYHDYDNDGDVDASDFALFAGCFGGANLPPNPACRLY